jgi:hypothetical protein
MILVRSKRVKCFLAIAACFICLTLTEVSIAQTSQAPAENYSGMYSFLQDGEFLQISVEEQGRVTGFISRFGDLESDRGAFLDHFFKEGKLDGKRLTFTTQTVHGIRYEFKGTFDRGSGKNPGDEAYYILKGTLTQFNTDSSKLPSSRSREVAFKSFPQDMGTGPEKRD